MDKKFEHGPHGFNYVCRIVSAWTVHQFENEYNPLHFHTGSMSGVCYILLPKNFGEKSQNQKKKNPNGCIALAHGSAQFNSAAIKLVTPKVGKFIFWADCCCLFRRRNNIS